MDIANKAAVNSVLAFLTAIFEWQEEGRWVCVSGRSIWELIRIDIFSGISLFSDSITPDEIEGAYEIATIHNGHPGYFLCGWENEKD